VDALPAGISYKLGELLQAHRQLAELQVRPSMGPDGCTEGPCDPWWTHGPADGAARPAQDVVTRQEKIWAADVAELVRELRPLGSANDGPGPPAAVTRP
jgi:hypothetical protein